MARSKKQKTHIQPVILCGGSGTRLWPVSRQAIPKQFAALASKNSLLQDTATWVSDKTFFASPILVSNQKFRFLIEDHLSEIGVNPASIILEPIARNTAPAIALAALHAAKGNPDTLLLVLPSDHVLSGKKAFYAALNEAAATASKDYLVTFGIEATSPETGYGYIQKGTGLRGQEDCYLVRRFVEKPDTETAQNYLASGDFLWNSGMFMAKAGCYLKELEHHHPALLEQCQKAMVAASTDGQALFPGENEFAACENISIDYAVMEKTQRAATVASSFGWSDVGSWPAVGSLKATDRRGNASEGDAILHSCENSFIHSPNRLVAAVGVKDLVIVDDGDAVLVASKDKAQEVKAVVKHLKNVEREEAVYHAKVERPWGSYEGLHLGASHQVKHIVVKPGGKLSSQYHHHRAEHWIIVSGTAEVTVGTTTKTMQENESVFIPVEAVHRLYNPNGTPLHLIEVQYGDYLGEDDIVRLDDIYGRVAAE